MPLLDPSKLLLLERGGQIDRRALNQHLECWLRAASSTGAVPLAIRNAWGSRAVCVVSEGLEQIRNAPDAAGASTVAERTAAKVRALAQLASLSPLTEVLYEKDPSTFCAECTRSDAQRFSVQRVPEHLVLSGHGRVLLELSVPVQTG